jgi:hypothetical protein
LRRRLSRTQNTIQTDKVLLLSLIIRLVANGHSQATIAKLVSTTLEPTSKVESRLMIAGLPDLPLSGLTWGAICRCSCFTC